MFHLRRLTEPHHQNHQVISHHQARQWQHWRKSHQERRVN